MLSFKTRLGLGMLASIVGFYAVASIALWLRLDLQSIGAVAVAAAVPLLAFAWCASAGDVRVRAQRAFTLVALVTAAWVAAGAAAAQFIDVSWDGQAYHQEAVIAFTDGWNPLRDGPLPVDSRADNLWINHYPKAAWIVEAGLFRLAGKLEAAKGLLWMAAIAAFFVVAGALRAHGWARKRSLWIAGTAAMNPIVTAQLFSFYVDGLLWSMLLASAGLVMLLRAPQTRVNHSVMQTLLALNFMFFTNMKFTGLVYGAMFVAALLGEAVWRRRVRLGMLATWPMTLGLFAGVCLTGFDPYITNMRDNGHPFFPIMGKGAVDIITPHVSADFHEHPRPVRLALSLFSQASNDNHPPSLKFPLATTASELRAFRFADVRIGGFGPWFGAIVLASLAFIRWPSRRSTLATLAGMCVVSAFANPALWWARYVPQLWIVPLLLLTAFWQREGATRTWRWFAVGAGALITVNAIVVLASAVIEQKRATCLVLADLKHLQQQTRQGRLAATWNGFEANSQRLQEAEIHFEHSQQVSCQTPLSMHHSRAQFCVLRERLSARVE